MYFEPFCLPESSCKITEIREEYVGETGVIGFRGVRKGHERCYNHMPAKEIRALLGNDIWDEYFKFTVVRNPFDKMLSVFYHLEKSRNVGKYLNDTNTDIDNFRRWIVDGGKVVDRDAYLINKKLKMTTL